MRCRNAFQRDFPDYFKLLKSEKITRSWRCTSANRWRSEKNWSLGRLAGPSTLLCGHVHAVFGSIMLQYPFPWTQYIFSCSASDRASDVSQHFGEIVVWDRDRQAESSGAQGWIMTRAERSAEENLLRPGLFHAAQRPETQEIVCTTTYKTHHLIRLLPTEDDDRDQNDTSEAVKRRKLASLGNETEPCPFYICHVGRLLGHSATCSYVRICKENSALAFTPSFDGLVNMYKLPPESSNPHEGPPIDIYPIFSLDDREFAISSSAPGNAATSIVVSALDIDVSGSKAASGGNDMYVKMWDVNSGQIVQRMPGCRGWIWSIVAADDHLDTLYSASTDGIVRSWDVRIGAWTSEFDCNAMHPNERLPAAAVAQRPDGVYYVAGCFDSNAYVVDRRMNRCVTVFSEHSDRISRVALYGDLVLSADFNGELRIWKF